MDRIDLLEAKVKQMIDLVQTLRDENGDLQRRLAEAEGRLKSASDERVVLDRERDQVRTRIEQLLGDLEGVGVPGEAGMGEGEAGGNGAGPHEAEAHGEEGEGRRSRRSAGNPVLPGLT